MRWPTQLSYNTSRNLNPSIAPSGFGVWPSGEGTHPPCIARIIGRAKLRAAALYERGPDSPSSSRHSYSHVTHSHCGASAQNTSAPRATLPALASSKSSGLGVPTISVQCPGTGRVVDGYAEISPNTADSPIPVALQTVGSLQPFPKRVNLSEKGALSIQSVQKV